MNSENMKSQMRKGILEFCILSVLYRGEKYPTEMLEQLKLADLIVVEGTLYPMLTRLKNEGMLHYRWEESPSGPPRKYYHLTDKGRQFWNELHTTWNELQQQVQEITKELPNQTQ